MRYPAALSMQGADFCVTAEIYVLLVLFPAVPGRPALRFRSFCRVDAEHPETRPVMFIPFYTHPTAISLMQARSSPPGGASRLGN